MTRFDKGTSGRKHHGCAFPRSGHERALQILRSQILSMIALSERYRAISVYGRAAAAISRTARPLVSELPVPISMFILARRKSTRLHASAAKRTNGDCEPFLPARLTVIDPLPRSASELFRLCGRTYIILFVHASDVFQRFSAFVFRKRGH